MIFMPCDTTTSFNCPAEAAPKMLTQQLRELENDHLIGRTVYPFVPPKPNINKTICPSELHIISLHFINVIFLPFLSMS